MKLHKDQIRTDYRIRGYGDGEVRINDTTYRASLIVTPTRLHTRWPPGGIDELQREHLTPLIEMEPEIVLLGTGSRQAFPEPALLAPFLERRIGVEVMTTEAACRTFNILVADERQVAAGLMIGGR